ncbi:hypothetical protein [Metabacillus halosaccharovorans]|uniref:hypothetical protein n=1 Tax=Metabacillus halosaccharovorans TaxID=930124 RepID=UPI000C80F7CE|nr:hypothetical protein [Metabacillus halosaccharovorans]MCM3443564.1 hypothetical protein [Metabacillus halosaccharovorans]PMC35029.1 hypothetical protein CJ195_21225 [Bacillus sp. UMB0899]
MPDQKLTIVPVTLLPENKSKSVSPPTSSSSSICTIKTANAEILFYNGVDEHIILTIMRELKHW